MFEKKQTGSDASDDKDKTSQPEQKEAGEGRKRGGKMPHHARKRGGHVPGQKAMDRPDKRARGGGVEGEPLTSAGKMSGMDYEKGGRPDKDEGGSGPDKNAKGFA
jgi:hypothetical protein